MAMSETQIAIELSLQKKFTQNPSQFPKKLYLCSPFRTTNLVTYRIKHLTEQTKVHHKDVAAKRALVGLVGKRRRLLDYLKRTDIERYRNIIKELGIRK